MITVHHLEHSRSQRLLWLLEELGQPYEIVRYARDAKTMLAPATLRAVHPLGKSPVITDGEITVAESGAIFEYLVDSYDVDRQLAPARGTAEWRRYTYWLHYAEGSLITPLLLKLIFSRIPKTELPALAAPLVRPLLRKISEGAQSSYVDPQIALHFDYVESELARSLWFAGDRFSAADIIMSFAIESLANSGGLVHRPKLSAFVGRIRSREAYQRAKARGGE